MPVPQTPAELEGVKALQVPHFAACSPHQQAPVQGFCVS